MTMSWSQKIICVQIMIAMCIYCILKSFPISGMMNIVKPPSQMETIYIFDLWSDITCVQRNEKKRYCQFFNVIGILKPAYIKRLGISIQFNNFHSSCIWFHWFHFIYIFHFSISTMIGGAWGSSRAEIICIFDVLFTERLPQLPNQLDFLDFHF